MFEIPECPDPFKDALIWRNVSDDIELKDGKANPFGWSYYRMEWKKETVGYIHAGYPELEGKNWQMTKVVDPEDNLTHYFFFKGLTADEWDAVEHVEKFSG